MDIELELFKIYDFDLYFKLVSDERVMAMITERAFPMEEARVEFQKLIEHNQLDAQFGSFKIINSDTSEFMGLAKLEVEEKGAESAELGYMILPQYWGQGLGTTVATKLVKQARKQQHLKQLTAIIDPKNIPSRKILINNGFESVSFEDFDGLPGEILELKLHR
ncbi:GNAT family N-acetyltransferase [Flavobacterium sp. HSC-61S13]|uniref:GNAT family N-acetyltransferase n=1 Tax=Flavobacterium sp. HSC-61S13 TaxID=2910963 RepID=UPI0020A22BCC|nr:GNAT family N-acetyltransferase [Flavobacterium sp. HSC-61S13]MCP1997044.1 RimJ/RimL family protein N-acetyltransferase [Flavobacterium sp. HSC-61S13]